MIWICATSRQVQMQMTDLKCPLDDARRCSTLPLANVSPRGYHIISVSGTYERGTSTSSHLRVHRASCASQCPRNLYEPVQAAPTPPYVNPSHLAPRTSHPAPCNATRPDPSPPCQDRPFGPGHLPEPDKLLPAARVIGLSPLGGSNPPVETFGPVLGLVIPSPVIPADPGPPGPTADPGFAVDPAPAEDESLRLPLLALLLKLIGLRPLGLSRTFSPLPDDAAPPPAPAAAPDPIPVEPEFPLKLATLEPKKLPIPLPIPPTVAEILANWGFPPFPLSVWEELADGEGEFGPAPAACRSLRAFSASCNLVATSFRTPSNALKREDDPAAIADDSASRVGASDSSNLRSCSPSASLSVRTIRPHTVPSTTAQVITNLLSEDRNLIPSTASPRMDVCPVSATIILSHFSMYECRRISHLGSQMSNKTGSVHASHSSNAFVFLNAPSHCSENGWSTFPSPPTPVIPISAARLLARNSAYLSDASAAQMYSSNRLRRSSSLPLNLLAVSPRRNTSHKNGDEREPVGRTILFAPLADSRQRQFPRSTDEKAKRTTSQVSSTVLTTSSIHLRSDGVRATILSIFGSVNSKVIVSIWRDHDQLKHNVTKHQQPRRLTSWWATTRLGESETQCEDRRLRLTLTSTSYLQSFCWVTI